MGYFWERLCTNAASGTRPGKVGVVPITAHPLETTFHVLLGPESISLKVFLASQAREEAERPTALLSR